MSLFRRTPESSVRRVDPEEAYQRGYRDGEIAGAMAMIGKGLPPPLDTARATIRAIIRKANTHWGRTGTVTVESLQLWECEPERLFDDGSPDA